MIFRIECISYLTLLRLYRIVSVRRLDLNLFVVQILNLLSFILSCMGENHVDDYAYICSLLFLNDIVKNGSLSSQAGKFVK